MVDTNTSTEISNHDLYFSYDLYTASVHSRNCKCMLVGFYTCFFLAINFSLLIYLCSTFHQIESIFEGRACTEMREASLDLTKRLAQTAQETFGDFEEAVEKDATKTAVLDGTVHPLTSYVINYVKFLFE